MEVNFMALMLDLAPLNGLAQKKSIFDWNRDTARAQEQSGNGSLLDALQLN
jgi:hypothetical protein